MKVYSKACMFHPVKNLMALKLTLTAYILLILAIPMLLCGCVVWVVEEVRNSVS